MGKNIKRIYFKIANLRIIRVIRNNYSNFFVCSSVFLSIATIAFIAFGLNPVLSSITFYLSIAIPFLWFAIYLLFNFKNIDFWNDHKSERFPLLFFVLFSVIFYFFCVILSFGNTKPSFDALKKSIITISCILEIFLVTWTETTKTVKRAFLLSSISATCILIIAFFLRGNIRHGSTNSLTLSFENPNALGLVLISLIAIEIIGLLHFKKIILKLLFVASAIICFVFLIMSKSRNSLLAILLCIVLLVYIRVKKEKKQNSILPWLITTSPLIICTIYTVLFFNENVSNFFDSFLQFALSGKSLSTRSTEWAQGFRLFGTSPFLGNYFISVEKSLYLSGYLNAYLDWLVEGGVFSTLFFVILIYQSVKKFWNSSISSPKLDSSYAFVFFPIVIFSSSFESGFFFGMHGLYIYTMLIGMFCDSSKTMAIHQVQHSYYEVNI